MNLNDSENLNYPHLMSLHNEFCIRFIEEIQNNQLEPYECINLLCSIVTQISLCSKDPDLFITNVQQLLEKNQNSPLFDQLTTHLSKISENYHSG